MSTNGRFSRSIRPWDQRIAKVGLKALEQMGLFHQPLPTLPSSGETLVDPYDSSESLEARALSYLHVNCSVCHVEAGGGNASMSLRFGTSKRRMRLIEARPQHASFGLEDAMLIAPGAPARSILVQRISRRGRGQMPPLSSTRVDRAAVQLFQQWVSQMEPSMGVVQEWRMEDFSVDPMPAARSFTEGETAFKQTGCVQCHHFAGQGGRVGPDLTGVGLRLRPSELLESVLAPSKVISEGFADHEIETLEGEIFSGRIEHVGEDVIVLRPPSSAEDPIRIAKKDIRSRRVSALSNMPSGMVNILTKQQVIDLLAYLLSDGDPQAPIYTNSQGK